MIRKVFFGLIAIIVLITVTVINLNVNVKASKGVGKLSEFSLANVEALAENEANPWYLWPFYGLTKDEYTTIHSCTWSFTIWIIPGIVGFTDSGPGFLQRCHDGGEYNCDSLSCQPL